MAWKNASQDLSEDSEYHEYHGALDLSLYIHVLMHVCGGRVEVLVCSHTCGRQMLKAGVIPQLM